MSKLRCARLLRMSPDWIKFDTHLIISVQLLIRKRKIEKYSYVFKKKKKATMNKTSLTGYESLIFQVHSYFEKGCGKSARDNPERYYGWFWIHCFSKEFERMTRDAMDVCLQVVKESNKSMFDSLSVRNSVLIISHITFRDCRLHIFSDNRSRNSCILCQDHGQSFLTIWTSRTFPTTKRGNIHQLRRMTIPS